MRTLNLGIVAHVDAGKTTLTEWLLHAAGVIDRLGRVDDGSTATDTLDLERARGITIKSAVVAFTVDDVVVNLIDTPGHPDFIAEVERVLGVLDGAVLVVSAVEGVQAQTRVLMRTLQRLRIPTVIFVNKIDRVGARYEGVLASMSERLTSAVVAMGTVDHLGTRDASWTPYAARDAGFSSRLVDLIAEHDDAILAAYVDDESSVSYGRLRHMLATQTRRAQVHPVFFGSAITGAGVDALTSGFAELLAAPVSGADPRDDAGGAVADAPVSGTVFKVERGPGGEKIAYLRMFSGTVRVRDRLRYGRGKVGKVTAIAVFDRGGAVNRPSVSAGRIARLWGLGDIRIGDRVGSATSEPAGTRAAAGAVGPVGINGTTPDDAARQNAAVDGARYFAPPTLETVVVPVQSERGALHLALAQLAEQDPLINLRQDDLRQEVFVSLYGEVQKEVIQATLASEYGLEVEFRESTTICIERPSGTGAAVEFIRVEPNPFLATIGLRVDPAPPGSGVVFRIEFELGALPPAFLAAVEDTVYRTLREGLYGWQVNDCTVTMTHSGYAPRQSHAHQGFNKSMSSTGADFRNLTPLVLMAALKEAGTRVHEPLHRFRLELPADTFAAAAPVLSAFRAVVHTQELRRSSYLLEGEVPAARVHELQQQLPTLTRGEGVLECEFSRYQPIRGPVPSRPRTDRNPLNREEYLLGVAGRVRT